MTETSERGASKCAHTPVSFVEARFSGTSDAKIQNVFAVWLKTRNEDAIGRRQLVTGYEPQTTPDRPQVLTWNDKKQHSRAH